MFNNTPSLADIATVTGNNDGFGNGAGWWFIIILALLFGWGNNGGGAFGGANGVTDGYILTSDFANIERKIDGVNNGLCSLGYDQLAQMNGINTNILNTGFNLQQAINNNTVADANNARNIAEQISGCCYENQRIALTSQNQMATEGCQTRQAIADAKAEILGFLTQDKLATLTAENQNLKFAQSQACQNQYLINALRPTPVPAYNVGYNPYGYIYGGTTIA